jgi:hypothetical protein
MSVRDAQLLLFSGDRLVAAGDRWIDASIAANVKSGGARASSGNGDVKKQECPHFQCHSFHFC